MTIFKGRDKYQKVMMEMRTGKDIDFYYDEISRNYSSSKGSGGDVEVFFHSPDVEDYEPKRWSDLEFYTIENNLLSN